jgi:hypothetical protein
MSYSFEWLERYGGVEQLGRVENKKEVRTEMESSTYSGNHDRWELFLFQRLFYIEFTFDIDRQFLTSDYDYMVSAEQLSLREVRFMVRDGT